VPVDVAVTDPPESSAATSGADPLAARAMPGSAPAPHRRRLALPLTRFDWRPGIRWFAAEFLVVVAGILAALALNAWWQGRQDASRAQSYLALISRDLRQMDSDLTELRAFEGAQVRDGLRAYRVVSAPGRTPAQEREVSRIVSLLLSRRTMVAVDAAYEDLTSTGNLRLIDDHALRDRIVSFYERAERELTIHNRNNAFFVDDQFVHGLVGQGLFQYRGTRRLVYDRTDSLVTSRLAGGYVEERDRIWTLPADGPEWASFRSLLLLRIDVASGALERTRRLQADVAALSAAVDSARTR
jgi:hypothetical protein